MSNDRIFTAALVVIGDEILSGRTQDKNIGQIASWLNVQGIRLGEVRVVADDMDAIAEAVNILRERNDYLFTTGGIGPTHDDITADCIAEAFGAHLDVRDDARAILAAHYANSGQELNAARLRMARIPDGATLIDNPVSSAPGFSLGNVHVMAGVPTVFQAMVASVLPGLTGGEPLLSQSLRVMRGEGDIAAFLSDLAARHGDLSIGCYPFQHNGAYGANVVIRGHNGPGVDAAMREWAQEMGL